MRKVMQLAALGTIAVGTYVGLDTASEMTANAATPVCVDSNGARSGGSVYLSYTTSYRCDVVSPQRLHITGTPSAQVCADMGGHGWTRANRTCWDVDY